MLRRTILISTAAFVLLPSLVPGAGQSRFERRRFQKQYREILRQYSDGAGTAAVDVLMAAEAAVVAEGGSQFVQSLRKAELAVIDEILPEGGPGLRPIIALHEKSYLRYRLNRRSMLIPHAREMVVELIGIYENSIGTKEGKVITSQMMASLAGHLQEARVDSAAANLYRRALILEGTNIAALIGLSFLHEQYGEYSEAVRLLATLVEIDPESGAAQLRLGVNLVRQGRENAGADYLQEALSEKNPRWIRSVAYQELARVLTDRDDLSGARALLEEGVKSVPDDPNLLIQLAYLSERNGSFSEDPALRLALRSSDDPEQLASPRFLYSELSGTTLDELRRGLEKQSDDHLSLLASALAAGSPRSGNREGQR